MEQVVEGPEDDADILRHEQMHLGYQANIDHCVHMLKLKNEDVEQYEKQAVALLERALAHPPATGANGRKRLMGLMHSCCITVNSCKLPKKSWHSHA